MLCVEGKKALWGVELMHKLVPKGIIAICSGEQGACLSFTPAQY